jgi:hypothetical protein
MENRNPIRKPPALDWNRLAEQCLKYNLQKDPIVRTALETLQINPDDRQPLEFIMEKLEEQKTLDIISPDPFRRLAPTQFDNVDGQIVLGMTNNGTFYGIDPDSLCRHLLIIGASGTGKSVIMILLASQIIKKDEQCR